MKREDMTSYIGYHGTTQSSAKSINKTQKFYISQKEEEWLGDGVYFFEKDIKQAYYYATKAKKYKNYGIIKSHIEANTVVDLEDTETREMFKKLARKLQDRHLKTKQGKPRKLINSVVLNVMYESNPYDVVRGIFNIPSTYSVERTNIVDTHIQLCVRNVECIKSIEEVEYNGC